MNSLLKKRLPGILAVGLVALAVGAASAPATAFDGAVTSSTSSAKKKELKKCKKIKKASKRKACIKRVNKKYATPPSKPVVVDVGDDYFAPTPVDLKVGGSIKWSWLAVNRNSHNVTLTKGPAGVSSVDFSTRTSPVRDYTFTKTFDKAGEYDFICSLHSTVMTMSVNVTK